MDAMHERLLKVKKAQTDQNCGILCGIPACETPQKELRRLFAMIFHSKKKFAEQDMYQ